MKKRYVALIIYLAVTALIYLDVKLNYLNIPVTQTTLDWLNIFVAACGLAVLFIFVKHKI